MEELRGKIEPADWFLKYEIPFLAEIAYFIIKKIDTSNLVVYPNGSGLFSSLLIQSGAEVIGIEINKKYQRYAVALNKTGLAIVEPLDLISILQDSQLILESLSFLYDTFDDLYGDLMDFLRSNISEINTILIPIMISEYIHKSRVIRSDEGLDVLVLSINDLNIIKSECTGLGLTFSQEKIDELGFNDMTVGRLLIKISLPS